ncbi:MAG TPA: 30S ribosomal protein S15 [Fibrobacteraceae bacterium]|nr:30S ribosomal protein S15 [Fibrobacteraceae bacterium]
MPSITKEKTVELATKLGGNEKNTGNVRVQVAILTERIRNLTEHFKVNQKDFHGLKGLNGLVSKRKRLMKYYAKTDLEGYRNLVKELGLRH